MQEIQAPSDIKRIRLVLRGQVQGVGFRPWVYQQAVRLKLTGHVRNTPNGLQVELQGQAESLNFILYALEKNPPPFAVIEHLEQAEIPLETGLEFIIQTSTLEGETRITFPPDLATCPECQQELFSPTNRRYQYPFINCTHCGPRFTIIQALPYDRSRTTMDAFPLCEACAREFHDPMDRRFEAQPNACPRCGPQVQLINADWKTVSETPVATAAQRLLAGDSVAVKGLGGYHLACLATSAHAVQKLRERKHRPHQALAVMFADLEELSSYCDLTPTEILEITSPHRPIVVVRRSNRCALPPDLSPDTQDIGALLPYTPLHHLLLKEVSPLVMTSGNFTEEPMAKDEDGLKRILGPIADLALIHNRAIARQCDDTVLKLVNGERLFIRRSRGFVPARIPVGLKGPEVLACGADLKNTFCLAQDGWIYLSQHIGDLEEYAAQAFYQEQIADFCRLHAIQPQVVAHDLHPEYHATRMALRLPIPHQVAVQHHHAHIAACMVEHQLSGKVIGVALDGTGYGPDGTIWGGEILIADFRQYQRLAHFQTCPMPGGEKAIYHPERMALSYLYQEYSQDVNQLAKLLPGLARDQVDTLVQMFQKRLHMPLTSSAGRLFDVVAALLGLAGTVTYEGQAAIQLQALADPAVIRSYPYEILGQGETQIICFGTMLEAILRDLHDRKPKSVIAAQFHNTLMDAITGVCEHIHGKTSLPNVVLSGGVFQNEVMLQGLKKRLSQVGLTVYSHHTVPPNDGGIAVGQAAVALARFGNRSGAEPCA